MIRINLLLLVMVFGLSNSKAQQYQKTINGVKATINKTTTEIQFYSPQIVRVLKWPANKTFAKESLSVVKAPEKVSVKIKQNGEVLSIASKDLLVRLNLDNGQVAFHKLDGAPLLQEKANGAVFNDFNDAGSKTSLNHLC